MKWGRKLCDELPSSTTAPIFRAPFYSVVKWATLGRFLCQASLRRFLRSEETLLQAKLESQATGCFWRWHQLGKLLKSLLMCPLVMWKAWSVQPWFTADRMIPGWTQIWKIHTLSCPALGRLYWTPVNSTKKNRCSDFPPSKTGPWGGWRGSNSRDPY